MSSYAILYRTFHVAVSLPMGQLAISFCVYTACACVTSGTAVPQGIFVPSLLMGALYGRGVGQLVALLNGDQYSSPMVALIGAASFLAGTTRITVALVAILVESTNSVVMCLPLLVAVGCAKIFGDMVEHGCYEVDIDIKEIPFLHPVPKDKAVFIEVSDIMSTALILLPMKVRVSVRFRIRVRARVRVRVERLCCVDRTGALRPQL